MRLHASFRHVLRQLNAQLLNPYICNRPSLALLQHQASAVQHFVIHWHTLKAVPRSHFDDAGIILRVIVIRKRPIFQSKQYKPPRWSRLAPLCKWQPGCCDCCLGNAHTAMAAAPRDSAPSVHAHPPAQHSSPPAQRIPNIRHPLHIRLFTDVRPAVIRSQAVQLGSEQCKPIVVTNTSLFYISFILCVIRSCHILLIVTH